MKQFISYASRVIPVTHPITLVAPQHIPLGVPPVSAAVPLVPLTHPLSFSHPTYYNNTTSSSPVIYLNPVIHSSHESRSFMQVAKEAYEKYPSQQNLNPPQPAPPSNLVQRAQVKVCSLQDKKALGFQVCFRCDNTSHYSHSYRNSLVCFSYGRLGHHSHQCRATIMFHPPHPNLRLTPLLWLTECLCLSSIPL
jgi:hypothetical protein